ncbi:MAG: glycosyltransferase [Actinomycetota bacterium]
MSHTLKRVAVISYHSSPLHEPGSGDAGGMTVYVRELAEQLAAVGPVTDIFTRADGDGRPVVELFPGVRVISIPAGPPEPLDKEELTAHIDEFVAGVRAFAASQRIRYDLVHSHYWQSGLVAKQLAHAWSVPFVHSNHTLGKVKNRMLAPGDVPEPLSRLKGEMDVIAASDVLIASTDEELEHLAGLYGADRDRLKTLHPGVDHRLFTPGDRGEARRQLDLGNEAVLLYVGRIQRLKGIDLALRAVEQLVPALDRPLKFLVVGGASGRGGDAELARLKSLASELEIDEHVRFVGAQPHPKLPAFYRAADAVVVSSHSETFGFAALEAHACGTPVVGTAVGGLSHVVVDGGSGFLIDTRDPSILAARTKTLLSDADLADHFSRAAVTSAGRFSWERAAEEFLELYECLVREDSPEACTC